MSFFDRVSIFSVQFFCAAILLLYPLVVVLLPSSSTTTTNKQNTLFISSFFENNNINTQQQQQQQQNTTTTQQNNNNNEEEEFSTTISLFFSPVLNFTLLFLAIFKIFASSSFIITKKQISQRFISTSSSAVIITALITLVLISSSPNKNNNNNFLNSIIPFSNNNNNNHFIQFIQPVSASTFGESPVASLEPADFAPLPEQEVEKRIDIFLEWFDNNTKPLYRTISKHNEKDNKNSNKQRGERIKNGGDENNNNNDSEENDDDNNFEMFDALSVGKPSDQQPTKDSQKSKNNKKKKLGIPFELSRPTEEDRNVRLILRRDVKNQETLMRIPASMLISYETICSVSRLKKNNNNKNKNKKSKTQQEETEEEEEDSSSSNSISDQTYAPQFCALAEALRIEASKKEECSFDVQAFQTGFQLSFLSLFLAYVRWGAPAAEKIILSSSSRQHQQQTTDATNSEVKVNISDSSSSFTKKMNFKNVDPAAKFFKPYVDMLPQIPPSPICTFTETDLEFFPLGKTIENSRKAIEGQWYFVFEKIAANFSHVFPEGSLTLPRYMWAYCSMRARLMRCFQNQIPCLFPLMDLANYRSSENLDVQSRLTSIPSSSSKQNNNNNNNTNKIVDIASSMVELRITSDFVEGEELLFDRDQNAMPFLHHGVIEHVDSSSAVCAIISLPTANQKSSNNNFSTTSSSSSTKEQQEEEISIANLFNPCAFPVLGSQVTSALTLVGAAAEAQQHFFCVKRIDLAKLLSLIDVLALYNTSRCNETNPWDSNDFEFHKVREEFLKKNKNEKDENFFDLTKQVPATNKKKKGNKKSSSSSPIAAETNSSTTESALRSVAYLGKLVRHQLEILSSKMTKLEKIIARATSTPHRSTKEANIGEDSSEENFPESFSSFSSEKKKSDENLLEKDSEKDFGDDGHHDNNNDDDDENINIVDEDFYVGEQQQPSFVSSAVAETSLCAGLGFGGGATIFTQPTSSSSTEEHKRGNFYLNNKNKRNKKGSSSSSSSSSHSSADGSSMATCRVLSSNSQTRKMKTPRHAPVILDWIRTQHAALVKIYDDLVGLRENLRRMNK